MASNDYFVSKFCEAEPLDPGTPGVSGSCSCFGRVACRSFLSSPPWFSGSCFQPLCLPSPRLGLRSGLALFVSGPRRAPLSFVFVLAALLAVRFASWSLDAGVGVPFFVSEFKVSCWRLLRLPPLISEVTSRSPWLLAVRLITLVPSPSPGLLPASVTRTVTSWSTWLLVARFDQPGKFLIAGLRETDLVFSEFEGFEGRSIKKEDFRKGTSQKPFEFPSSGTVAF